MKVFLAGETHPWSCETHCAATLRQLGCEVRHWNSSPSGLYKGCDLLPWETKRVGRALCDATVSLSFHRACVRYRPDVVFFLKAANIHSYAIRRALGETNARLVIWYPDNPFWANQTTISVIRRLRRCDVFYTWGKFLVETLRSAGCRRVEYLPFGFYEPYYLPQNMQSNDRGGPYSTDVVFAGEWDEEREAVLGTMTDFKLSIFGPGWGRMCRLQQVRQKVRGDGLFGPDLAGVYKGARVVFNHLRPHNGSAHNMRTMEIAGIGGGVQLVRRTKEQAQDLFAENASIFCYEGSEELRVKLEWLLGRSESHLREVSSQARAIVQRQHLLLDRMKKLISDVTSI